MSFEVKQNGKTFDVYCDGELFTSCVYESEYVRPFMGPVYTSFKGSFTRFEKKHKEHPHQRSVFVGIGDVNGVDFWNEDGEGKGKMVLDSVLSAEGGDTAVVKVKLVWKSIEEDKPYLDEIRSLTFEKKEDCIAVRVSLEFYASYGDVTFGQTKEAGPLGIRVADELRADGGGMFVNSEGGINEEYCWGKDAKWCNYSGEISGNKVGIACYDSESNERYPTAWHIRNYGLMAANNLYFKGGYDLKAGEKINYDYLICFWEKEFEPEKYSK